MPQRRDALGHVFFWHHHRGDGFHRAGLAFALAGRADFLSGACCPLVVLQWQLNRDSCVLNNLECLIRTGRWRNPENPEEGAFLLELVRRVTGLEHRPRRT